MLLKVRVHPAAELRFKWAYIETEYQTLQQTAAALAEDGFILGTMLRLTRHSEGASAKRTEEIILTDNAITMIEPVTERIEFNV